MLLAAGVSLSAALVSSASTAGATSGDAPSFGGASYSYFTATQANASAAVTVSGGSPEPAQLSVASGLPSWLSFDTGSGVFSGTPPFSAVGPNYVTLQASNGDFSATRDETFVVFVQAPVVTLPSQAPTSQGLVEGVQTTTAPNSAVSWSGLGFAAGARVTVGVYPSSTYADPVVMGRYYANGAGYVLITGPTPAVSGVQYVVAAGYASDGSILYLTGQTNFMSAPSGQSLKPGAHAGGRAAQSRRSQLRVSRLAS